MHTEENAGGSRGEMRRCVRRLGWKQHGEEKMKRKKSDSGINGEFETKRECFQWRVFFLFDLSW